MRSQSHSFIYLDHNATTPVDPFAAKAMMPFIQEDWQSLQSLSLRNKGQRKT